MASTKEAPSKSLPTIPRFLSGEELDGLNRHIHERICERAFQLFEASGRVEGHDQEHWLRAESEILQRGISVRESGSWLAIDASLPGVSSEDVQIYLEPRRVVIRAKRDRTASGSGEQPRIEEMFLTGELMVDSEPSTATASLRDNALLLMVKKRSAAAAAS